jgi:hypothetical protein
MPARLLVATLGANLLLASCGAARSSPQKLFFQKGVNFTAEWPDTYSSDGARKILGELTNYGVNSIALVPYGFCRKGTPLVRFNGRRAWEKDTALAHMTAFAHEHGMKVMLKPQVWVPRSYPGELEFASPHDREMWFSQYQAFLEHYAKLAEQIGADLFCVGVEFSKLSRYEQEWRRLIARVREIYAGPLVYAANFGTEFESIRFWDALDYIGLNNYYPLPDDLSTDAIVAKVEQVQRRYQRPVIFPEAGFPSLEDPHRQPWDETPRRLSLDEQARCYEAVFRAFYHKPWFEGVYWWKVGSNGFGGPDDGSHTPWGKPAMKVIAHWYLHGGRN